VITCGGFHPLEGRLDWPITACSRCDMNKLLPKKLVLLLYMEKYWNKGCVNFKYFRFSFQIKLDCIHDIPEGLRFFFKLCLKWDAYKEENWLNAECINEKIISFHYGRYDSGYKPRTLFTDTHLKEHGNYSIKHFASQNLYIFRNFTLMFENRCTRLSLIFRWFCNGSNLNKRSVTYKENWMRNVHEGNCVSRTPWT
jgi:hypothetical protein